MIKDLRNILGQNYRLGEIEAAMGREQLKRLDGFTAHRDRLAQRLSERLREIPGIRPPIVRAGVTHGWYIYAIQLDPQRIHIPRDLFSRALAAEGVPNMAGYMKPLYSQPVYQQTALFGDGYPFRAPYYKGTVRYAPGCCPITETVQERLIDLECVRQPLQLADMDQLADAFAKIVAHQDDLAGHAEAIT
jgi:dTDP-4-amino-4,6-dideoxygalactose transaminase